MNVNKKEKKTVVNMSVKLNTMAVQLCQRAFSLSK